MEFLDILHLKGVEYAEFDPQRFPQIFKNITASHKAKIIQIIGTNGKGSTGRVLAEALFKKGFQVAHFTSPHITSINERFWLNGELLSDEALERNHQILKATLSKKELEEVSYFEYLTLLCFFSFKDQDFLVLEAGLGGEFDSTTSLPIDLQLFTKIGLDHCEFLGESIEKIATTKLKAMKTESIVGFQDEKEIKIIAKKIASQNGVSVEFVDEKALIIDDFKDDNEPLFLGENRALAYCALEKLQLKTPPKDLIEIKLFGRLTKFAENIYLDVGHNLSAAKEMRRFFQDKKVIIIYNSYKEKDFLSILFELKPITKKLLYLPIEAERIAKKEDIVSASKTAGISLEDFTKIDKDEIYLVFGSFLCVENFLGIWERFER